MDSEDLGGVALSKKNCHTRNLVSRFFWRFFPSKTSRFQIFGFCWYYNSKAFWYQFVSVVQTSRSVVQCVAVCCSVLQCGAVRCGVLRCGAVRCGVLQCEQSKCNENYILVIKTIFLQISRRRDHSEPLKILKNFKAFKNFKAWRNNNSKQCICSLYIYIYIYIHIHCFHYF